MGKDTKTPTGPSLSQMAAELKTLVQQFRDMREIVTTLKDILLTKDNWHSKIVKWMGKNVVVCTDHGDGFRSGTMGKLLWADRYHIGLEASDRDDPKTSHEYLVNKGHIIWIREA